MTVEPQSRVTEMVPVGELVPHPQNPRRGNVVAIRESIRLHGWHGAIVAQRSTKRILVGAHRLQAAVAEGYTEVPVDWKDVDDTEAIRIILADNRASDMATWANDDLLETLKGVGYVGTLFDVDAVESLAATVGEAIAPMPEFKGDYADAGQEMEQRKVAAEKIGQEMRDVVLVLKPEDYATFQADIKALSKRWAMPGVIAVTIASVHRCALEEGDITALQLRLSVIREWGKKLLWAVDADKQAEFKELLSIE